MLVRRVVGDSMMPALKEGQYVLARKRPVRVRDIVIARCDGMEVIKRVVDADVSSYDLAGDHPDTARYNNVQPSDILGVVIWPRQKHR